MKTYTICNSRPGYRSLGYRVREVARVGRDGEGLTFYYERRIPSKPTDVLNDTVSVVVGDPETSTNPVEVRASGVVDDRVTVRIGGFEMVSETGDDVVFDEVVGVLKPGYYSLSVEQWNDLTVADDYNESYLDCFVSNVRYASIVPDVNPEPVGFPGVPGKEKEKTKQCNSDEDNSGGLPQGETRSYKAVERYEGDWTTTSGGRQVVYSVDAQRMEWSTQFGVFRGLAQVPAGRLSITAEDLESAASQRGLTPAEVMAELGSPRGLSWVHPLSSWLALPDEGAHENEMLVLVEGERLTNYMVSGDGRTIFAIGASMKSTTRLMPVREISRLPRAACPLSEAVYIRASFVDGSATFYLPATGQCIAYLSAEADDVSATLGEQYAAVVRDDEGTIRQVWNTWDGVADVQELPEGGYTISIYPPAQVQPPVQMGDLYSVSGEPVKVFTVRADVEAMELVVTEIDNTVPMRVDALRLAWVWRQRAWSLAVGRGSETVETQQEHYTMDDEHFYVLRRMVKGGEVASCVREDYEVSAQGQLLLSRTIGYGEPGSLTTTYVYNDRGLVIESRSPKNGTSTYNYDAYGRMTCRVTPWGAEGVRQEDIVYNDADDEAYSAEPSKVNVYYAANGYSKSLWRSMSYEYAVQDGVRTVTRRVAGAQAEEQVSVSQSWLAVVGVPEYAVGRVKMERGVDGVESHYSYEATHEHDAVYKVTEEKRVGGELVLGRSTRRVSYISAEGNATRDEDYALSAEGEWLLINGASHEYDALNRRVATTWDNGRSEHRVFTCQSRLLEETDANGITTHYSYNSARQLIETTRSAVYDGEQCITPETITEYVCDAASRVTRITSRTGPMVSAKSNVYDLQGRQVKSTDELGRVTLTSYSEDGLTTRVTTPAGAELVTQYFTDGSVAVQSGNGQRLVSFSYDYVNGLRTNEYAGVGENRVLLSQRIVNGVGQIITITAPTTLENAYIYTRSVYNAKGQLVRYSVGDGAPVLYEYDAMGAVSKQTTLLDAAEPDSALSNRISLISTEYVQVDGIVYQMVATQHNTAQGEWLTSSLSTLVSQLSPTLEAAQVLVDERGHTTTQYTEYGEGAVRVIRHSIPTSDIEAQLVTADGFEVSSMSALGITEHHTRTYREGGMLYASTDGRGNTTITKTDIAGRTIEVTNAAGDITRTIYEATSNNPAVITDAQGNTTCYAYDVRGQKVAEWGTAVQPATYEYDDAGRLTALTTWRDPQQIISSDPSGLSGGDTTRWVYDEATGLVIKQIYPDGSEQTSSYTPQNYLRLLTDARGASAAYQYDVLTGLLTQVVFSGADYVMSVQSYEYDLYGQPVRVSDAGGERTLRYDRYGELVLERQVVEGEALELHERWDAYGRSVGYNLVCGGVTLGGGTVGYAADGRVECASLLAADGVEHGFSYAYLPGAADLLQQLTMPNGMRLVQTYDEKRNLIMMQSYLRGDTLVVRRSYTYNELSAPTTRKTERRGGVMDENFAYNPRLELVHASRSGDIFDYAYDNIGNRTIAHEAAEHLSYDTNELNQYTLVDTNGIAFVPEYDAAGNQTRLHTVTGTWSVEYDAAGRAVRYESADGDTVVSCIYDYMGRRVEKKVEQNGVVTQHERYLYRGYVQVAALDMMHAGLPLLRHIMWDPTQDTATRPLALQTSEEWCAYGWDAFKNVTEVFTDVGLLDTDYVYTPYGAVRPAGSVTQPIQWSSEVYDPELGLVYYNYRYYNPIDGRWTRRDPIGIEGAVNLYSYVKNGVPFKVDGLGLADNYTCKEHGEVFIREKTYALSYGLFPISPDDADIINSASQISRYLKLFVERSLKVLKMTSTVFESPGLVNELIKASQKNKESGRLVVYCNIKYIVCVDCGDRFKQIEDETTYVYSKLVLPQQVTEGKEDAEYNATRKMNRKVRELLLNNG